VASEDETFDPNDLDSIDALLDEAELEVSETSSPDPVPEADRIDADEVNLDDMDLTELTDDLADADLIEEDSASPEAPSDNKAENSVIEEEGSGLPPPVTEKSKDSKSMDDSEKEFVSKRTTSNKASPKEVTVAEMDSIKKLVIIFGSVLIVLVLTAIGMGVWSALAASGGLDEETQTIIEDIQASTVSNTLSNTENTKIMGSVEKKLDALSFQLEQLTTDIATLEDSAKSVQSPVVMAISPALDTHGKPVAENHGTNHTAVAPVIAHSAAPVATDHAVLDKLSVVSSKMVNAQKRIDEVNRRVKDIQSQYGKLMHSVKVVEKQLVDQQAKEAKLEKDNQKPVQGDGRSPYQYNSSDAMLYDQANPDSYP